MVVIADVHFSFHTPRDEGIRKTVTQVMDLVEPGEEREEDAAYELIHAIRRTHETLLRSNPLYARLAALQFQAVEPAA